MSTPQPATPTTDRFTTAWKDLDPRASRTWPVRTPRFFLTRENGYAPCSIPRTFFSFFSLFSPTVDTLATNAMTVTLNRSRTLGRIVSVRSSPPRQISLPIIFRWNDSRIVSFLPDGSTTDDGGSRFSLFPFLSNISVRAQLVKLVYRSIEFWNCLVAIFFRTNRVGRKEEKDAKQMIKI